MLEMCFERVDFVKRLGATIALRARSSLKLKRVLYTTFVCKNVTGRDRNHRRQNRGRWDKETQRRVRWTTHKHDNA